MAWYWWVYLIGIGPVFVAAARTLWKDLVVKFMPALPPGDNDRAFVLGMSFLVALMWPAYAALFLVTFILWPRIAKLFDWALDLALKGLPTK